MEQGPQQRLNNVDQTHLVLASGKLVLQKGMLREEKMTAYLRMFFKAPYDFALNISFKAYD